MVRRIIIVMFVLFAGYCAIGAIFCRRTLHVARQTSAAPQNVETVSITAKDGAKLSAWWMMPPKRNGNCVVVLHGVGGSRASSLRFAPMFLKAGYNLLLPDSRGHGASEGSFVTYGLLEKHDVLGWAEWMKSEGCVNSYALGESLGASVLIQTAAVQPVFSAIVAECPFADLREAAEFRMRRKLGMSAVAWLIVSSGEFYARWMDGVDLDGVSPVRAIAAASTPILLIHGMSDSRTPYSDSERLERANPKNVLWLVPNAEHIRALAAAPEEFQTRVLRWFGEH